MTRFIVEISLEVQIDALDADSAMDIAEHDFEQLIGSARAEYLLVDVDARRAAA